MNERHSVRGILCRQVAAALREERQKPGVPGGRNRRELRLLGLEGAYVAAGHAVQVTVGGTGQSALIGRLAVGV